ncbi:MAG: hypothetical protein ACI819_002589 [Neolewinella sp.]|jgi:hypothetical protein
MDLVRKVNTDQILKFPTKVVSVRAIHPVHFKSTPNKATTMRYPPEATRQFFDDYQESGQTVAAVCDDNDIKVPTFYSWKKEIQRSRSRRA